MSSKDGPTIEFPDRSEYVSDVVVVDGRLVRPSDVLLNLRTATDETRRELTRRQYRIYDPRDANRETDWRQRPDAPPYGDINAKLRETGADIELWHVDGPPEQNVPDQVDLIDVKKFPGAHYNHVVVGADFYHGGPGGPPSVDPGPASASLNFSFAGDTSADIAVLDNGLPKGWEKLHGELKPAVTRTGSTALPDDPMDEDHDNRLDRQAGHGLFICGLISRVAPDLDILLNRVLHASGEGEESLIIPTLRSLLGSSVKVINLSLGAIVPGKDGPLLASTIRDLVREGKIVVASAGNSGDTDHGTAALFPANMPEVIAVGAYNSICCDEPKPWRKSCRGDVYAPGVDLVSSHVKWHGWTNWADFPYRQNFKGWAAWSGTSFAAPLVAAEIAQLLATPPKVSAQQAVKDWLGSLPMSEWPNKKNSGKAPYYEPSVRLTEWS